MGMLSQESLTKTLFNRRKQQGIKNKKKGLVLMKRKASAFMLMIVLLFSIVSISFVDFAEANPPPVEKPPPLNHVYVKSDFTLTGNLLNSTLEVQSDNVVIDGAGFALEGNGGFDDGVGLNGKSNVTIKNLTIRRFGRAMEISGTSNHITVAGNTLIGNAIVINDSPNNTIIDNNMDSSHLAINRSNNNTVLNNHFDGMGIHIRDCKNNHVSQNYFDCCLYAVYLTTASYNIISANVVSNGFLGIIVDNSSENIIIANNITGASVCGIRIAGSLSNNITRNFLYNNSVGFHIRNSKIILLSQFTNKNLMVNFFSQNDVCNNNESVRAEWAFDNPVSEDLLTDWHKMPIFLYGNYWSDYDGTDSDGDGVGNTHYFSADPSYVDSYPLMVPTYIRNVTVTTPNIQTIDELRSDEIGSTNFSGIFAAVVFYGTIILIAIGLVIYFKKHKDKH